MQERPDASKADDGAGIGRRRVLLRATADFVRAFVAGNRVDAHALPDLLRAVHAALSTLQGESERAKAPAPAVPIRTSVQRDFIICLEDGKKLKMLKRYLRAKYDLSPDEYRKRWSLAPDYPMVAPAYAERRSAFAKQIGLGKGVRKAARGG